MTGRRAEAVLSLDREQKWETVRTLVRDLEVEHDLPALAAIAEVGLVALRQLCERPVTCDLLSEMLADLHRLKLDEFEAGEEE